ncbi:MAG: acyltransferase [Lachnospiraceae bacterium]|nr:acyltransferase [Lachnospiraceae bacterium]
MKKEGTVLVERKNYLDVAKLFAVLTVIYVHSSIVHNPIRRTITAFFMPVFFVLYGIASSKRPIRSFKEVWEFFLKKVKSLLVPYGLWAMICASSINVNFLKGVVFGSNYSLSQANTNAVLWFLPCMFVAVLVFQVYVNIRSRISRRAGRIGLSLLAMVICGIISLWFNPYPCFFGFDIAFSGCLFMIIGEGYSEVFGDYWEKKPICVKLVLGMILFVITYVLVTLNLPYLKELGYQGVVMALGAYGRYDLFLGGAIAGSLALLMIAMLFQKVRLFAYMGRFSLVIMAVHHILFTFVKPLCNPIQNMRYGGQLFPITVTLCCFVICIPLCFIIDWAVPELNGKHSHMKRQELAAVQSDPNKSGVNISE